MLYHQTLSSLIWFMHVSEEIKLSGAFSLHSSQWWAFPTAPDAISILEYWTEVILSGNQEYTAKVDVSYCRTLKERKNMRGTLLSGEKSTRLQTLRRGRLAFCYSFNMYASALLKFIDYIHWYYTIGDKNHQYLIEQGKQGENLWYPQVKPKHWTTGLDRFSLLNLESVCHPRRKIFVTKRGWSLLLVLEIQGTEVSFFPTIPWQCHPII